MWEEILKPPKSHWLLLGLKHLDLVSIPRSITDFLFQLGQVAWVPKVRYLNPYLDIVIIWGTCLWTAYKFWLIL